MCLFVVFATDLRAQVRDTVPEPTSVMFKSLMVPGWGQIVNEQRWKVPIIYAALGGIVAYQMYSHDRYAGYRAAYYNSQASNTDKRFGPTPDWVPSGQPSELYKANRDLFRNRRDMAVVYAGLAWGFNALDAYIFAHLKDFDVSDDVSLRLGVGFERGPTLRLIIPIHPSIHP
jgi:hypothetical protein